jgi:hypothetical protein
MRRRRFTPNATRASRDARADTNKGKPRTTVLNVIRRALSRVPILNDTSPVDGKSHGASTADTMRKMEEI